MWTGDCWLNSKALFLSCPSLHSALSLPLLSLSIVCSSNSHIVTPYNMAASTATVTTATKKQNGTATLRMKPDTATSKDAPKMAEKDTDFFWTYTEEPHRTRRMAIIKAHPEVGRGGGIGQHPYTHNFQVTKLCGPEPLTKYVVVFVVALQVLCAYLLRDTSFFSWKFFLTAYIVGATANQNCFLAIHEISHNLAFRSPIANRLLAIFANLPIGIPYSASFRVSMMCI